MLNKGIVIDEIGERCGEYWFRPGMNAFHLRWLNIHMDGYTEEGLYAWAERMGLCLIETFTPSAREDKL